MTLAQYIICVVGIIIVALIVKDALAQRAQFKNESKEMDLKHQQFESLKRRESDARLEKVTLAAFEAIRTASAEERARAEAIRMQSAVEIDALKRDFEKAEDSDGDTFAQEHVRKSMSIKTLDGRILEPLFPGDVV